MKNELYLAQAGGSPAARTDFILMISKNEIAQIQLDMEAAYKIVLAKHGLQEASMRITYNQLGEVNFTIKTRKPEAAQARVNFSGNSEIVIGKTQIQMNGQTMTVVDYARKNRKYPWIVENMDGTRYKISEATLRLKRCEAFA